MMMSFFHIFYEDNYNFLLFFVSECLFSLFIKPAIILLNENFDIILPSI